MTNDRRLRAWFIVVVTALVAVAGCSTPPGPRCTPGTTAACACPGGAVGTQRCGADARPGACECATTDAAPSDAADAPAPDAPARGFGAPCMRDDECDSRVCLMIGRCSRPCAGRTDCPGGTNWMCVGLPARGNVCACAPTGPDEVGCNGVDDDCDGVTDDTSRDCDGLCVDAASDARNCGGCGIVCGAGTVCRRGMCVCPPERATVCGGVCNDVQTSTTHCGRCDNRCPTGPRATPTCVAGACDVTCAAGFANCNRDVMDGCEAELARDTANCGACGTACAFANASAACTGGACALTVCAPGFENCNGAVMDGCEADVRTDRSNCGACGRACALTGATAACTTGACVVAMCNPGLGDCDRVAANGCEVDTASDALNCGACGNVCPARPNSRPACAAARCAFVCNFGFADCDGNTANGCETPTLSDPASCGACGMTCPPRANATSSCAAGMCTLTCASGFADCDGMTIDGCEAELAASTAHCGGCGRPCTRANASPVCRAGSCAIGACNPGFADCNGVDADGCEVDTRTDPTHCGACATSCPGAGVPNTIATCAASACGFSCATGFADCDGSTATGCEANTATSVAHCGGCGRACASVPNGSPRCAAGTCGFVCDPGFMPAGGACVPATTTTVTFPSTMSTVSGPTVSGSGRPLGAGGGGALFQMGDAVAETFTGRTAAVSGLDLDFQMSDVTLGCASGQILRWNVLVNGTVVGEYNFSGGSAMNPRRITRSFTFPAVLPVATNQFTLRIEATTSVCSGGASWNFIAGGTAVMR